MANLTAEIDYDAIDPGVRETVRRLNALGFETTDSGDGVSKLDEGYPADEILDFPHVYIRCAPRDVANVSARLKREIERRGFCVEPVGHSSIWIQATLDPADGTATILLAGVTDAGWRAPEPPTMQDSIERAMDMLAPSGGMTYQERSEFSRLKHADVDQGRRIAELLGENAALRALLAEAIDLAEEGWDYASPYFKDKHDSTGRICALKARQP